MFGSALLVSLMQSPAPRLRPSSPGSSHPAGCRHITGRTMPAHIPTDIGQAPHWRRVNTSPYQVAGQCSAAKASKSARGGPTDDVACERFVSVVNRPVGCSSQGPHYGTDHNAADASRAIKLPLQLRRPRPERWGCPRRRLAKSRLLFQASLFVTAFHLSLIHSHPHPQHWPLRSEPLMGSWG